MADWGARAPLNKSGMNIVLRNGNKDDTATFMKRVVKDVLTGSVKNTTSFDSFVDRACSNGVSKQSWEDLLVELSGVNWLQNCTLPKSVAEKIQKDKDQKEAKAKHVSKGVMLTGDKLAAIQAKLRGEETKNEEEEVEGQQDTPTDPDFSVVLKDILAVYVKELKNTISLQELGLKFSQFQFLTTKCEVSDEFYSKFRNNVAPMRELCTHLKQVVEKRKEKATKRKSRNVVKKTVDKDLEGEFSEALSGVLKVFKEQLGGHLTKAELGGANPRLDFLCEANVEYSDKLYSEFHPDLETSELNRASMLLKIIAGRRKARAKKQPAKKKEFQREKTPERKTPAKVEVSAKTVELLKSAIEQDISEPEECDPVNCIITRNQDNFKAHCKKEGLTIDDEIVKKLMGTRHTVTMFNGDTCKITVDGKDIWIPSKDEVLMKIKTKKKPAKRAPEKKEPAPVEKEPVVAPVKAKVQPKIQPKRNPEKSKMSSDSKEVARLQSRVQELERELKVVEKQKELYQISLANLKARTPSKMTTSRDGVLEIISEADFSRKVRNFPRSNSRVLLVPSMDANGLHKVNLFVWLEANDKPTLNFDIVSTTGQHARDLACTIANRKLGLMAQYKSHFN